MMYGRNSRCHAPGTGLEITDLTGTDPATVKAEVERTTSRVLTGERWGTVDLLPPWVCICHHTPSAA